MTNRLREYLKTVNPGIVICTPDANGSPSAKPEAFDKEQILAAIASEVSIREVTGVDIDSDVTSYELQEPEPTQNSEFAAESDPLQQSEMDENESEIYVFPPEYQEHRLESFDALPAQLSDALKRHLSHIPDPKPLPVQQYTYNFFREGMSLLVRSPTGSGKTLAFLLPIIAAAKERRMKYPSYNDPFAIILGDTKDLLEQHFNTCMSICATYGVTVAKMFSGSDTVVRGKKPLMKDIVIASPGKLSALIMHKKIHLHQLNHLVIDEADEFFFPGKFHYDRELLSKTLEECRKKDPRFHPCVALFSATLLRNGATTVDALDCLLGKGVWNMNQIGYVEVVYKLVIEQRIIPVDNVCQKLHFLTQLLDMDLEANLSHREDPEAKTRIYNNCTIVFCDKRKTVYFVSAFLVSKGFYARAHTGRMEQRLRNEHMKMLREGRLPILVTTNAIARGIDVDRVNHVIMYELPFDNWDAYTHRVGRTGRAGRTGVATVLFDKGRQQDIQRGKRLFDTLYVFRQKIPRFLYEQYAPTLTSREADRQSVVTTAELASQILDSSDDEDVDFGYSGNGNTGNNGNAIDSEFEQPVEWNTDYTTQGETDNEYKFKHYDSAA